MLSWTATSPLPHAGIAVVTILLSGCATVGDLPRAKDPANASTVLLTHNKHFSAGTGGAFAVALDGKKFARIGTGDCMEFTTDPGRHFLVLLPGALNQAVFKFIAAPGETIGVECHIDLSDDRYLWCEDAPAEVIRSAIVTKKCDLLE